MIGICPHCKIRLKEPPFSQRETNEIMIVMIYRAKLDNKVQIKTIEELGYCEVCRAKLDDLKEQEKAINI
jgi:hypothetical protein